jgi:8-oxo-dGTP pyrophosphatase MutT (NUDIX family)
MLENRLRPVSIKGVLFIDKKVVLLRNDRDEWELPGGRLEKGETPEACLQRELNEELSSTVEVGEVLEVVSGKLVLILAYHCLLPSPITAFKLSEEHKEVRLFSVSELSQETKDLVTMGHCRFARDLSRADCKRAKGLTMPEPASASYEQIRRYIMIKTPLEPADLAFVFGTRHGVTNFADEIANYWQKHFFPWIFIAGGPTKGQTVPESDTLKDSLVRRSVPPDRIICERRSTNTGENVEFSLPIIDHHFGIQNIHSLIAVGKISSSRRYLMTLERHWPGRKKMILPIN